MAVVVNGTTAVDGNNCNNGSGTKMEGVESSDVKTITIEDNMAIDTKDAVDMQVDEVDGPSVINDDANGNSRTKFSDRRSMSGKFEDRTEMDVEHIAMVNGHGSECPTVNGTGCPSEEASSFNTFQFWRVPIPDLKPVLNYVGPAWEPIISWELDDFKIDSDEQLKPTDLSTRTTNATSLTNCDQTNGDPSDSSSQQYNGNVDPSNNNGASFGQQQHKRIIPEQDTIPSELLEHYLNMTSPANFDSIDNDLTHHCAFSLPAVAMTLGRKHWPCLRDTFESLSVDMQWKVRWTLASSLHQMAQILGPEYTSKDLLPAFLSFMKDLDEVRFGVLQNLSSILKILNRPEQLAILPKVTEFMKMDNPRNWRFRATLGQQINAIVTLYHPSDIKEYLLPVAFALLRDKVSEVRIGSIKLLSTIMRHFYCDTSAQLSQLSMLPAPGMVESARVNLECLLISELTSLVDSSKWIYRQVFVFLTEQMITDKALPIHIFVDHFIPPLVSLADDRVPNIRMALARCLVRSVYGNLGMCLFVH